MTNKEEDALPTLYQQSATTLSIGLKGKYILKVDAYYLFRQNRSIARKID